jgi:site-specific recombinase XerD
MDNTALINVSDNWKAAAGAWLVEVGKRTGSKRTPVEYARILQRFIDSIGGPEHATAPLIHTFAYSPGPSGKDPSPSTVTVRLAALRGFFDFAKRMGVVSANPADDVKRPKSRQPTPKGLDAEELKKLIAVIPDTPVGLRDKAIILTAVFTGLRRQEVMGLHKGDIYRNGSVFFEVRAKGGVLRRRELPAPALTAIEKALEARGLTFDGIPTDRRLFDVSHQGFYANLRRYAKKARLEHVTPHVLRHSAAKLRRDTGASIEGVQEFLGHQSIATTARYLARMEGEHDNTWQAVANVLGVK